MKLNLAFYEAVPLHDQKARDKYLNIFRTERAFKMKQKALFIIFKGLTLKQVKSPFLKKGESDFKQRILKPYDCEKL